MKKIGLDAGHGLNTAGKQTPDGIKEWTLNDKVRDKVVKILSDYEVEIINTDEDEGNTDESLSYRVNKYLKAGVDAFVSIHHNAYTGTWNSAIGVEVYTDVNCTAKDTQLANLIYDRMVKYIGLRGRGVKKMNFAVINQNSIPAVLCEGGFMDSTTDYKVITSDSGQTAYAKAVAEALISFLDLKKKESEPIIQNGFQASDLKNLTSEQVIAKVGHLFTEDQKKTGILASVSFAQFILESAYGSSELAINANNVFGMKTSLSGNTWPGSTWTGDIYTKETSEYINGAYKKVTADFRKYSCVEDSIEDHSAYLLGAKKGTEYRYKGLKGEKDYKKAFEIIHEGGYATSPTYVENLCDVVEKWNLTKYDLKEGSEDESNETPSVPFTVKVLVNDFNYRKEPSDDSKIVGQTGKGVFTIVELSGEWGKLKSGAGWVYLGEMIEF